MNQSFLFLKTIPVFIVVMIFSLRLQAYSKNPELRLTEDSVQKKKSVPPPEIEQTDIRDFAKKLFSTKHHLVEPVELEDSDFVLKPISHPLLESDSAKTIPGKVLFAAFPGLGYTLQTGTTAILAMNFSFYTAKSDSTNLSSIAINPTASLSHHQFLLPAIFNIWTKKNKFNLTGDLRYYKYPTYTYGLGGHTTLANADLINYNYIRYYQQVLRQIAKTKFYAGVGYNFDYHFGIKEEGTASDFHLYNLNATRTISSGLSATGIFDNRKNINNPENATYSSLSYRYNSKLLGSDADWESVQLEFKKFIQLSSTSKNVLAFWNLNWFTFGGKPPYFDLPSTGWDSYSNTGRGYIQGRLRGPGMVYVESEFRYRITRNGLLGGVLFVNAESVAEWKSYRFETILPGTGFGMRLKLNKNSGANLAIDYGFGTQGSQGLFFNVSEVF